MKKFLLLIIIFFTAANLHAQMTYADETAGEPAKGKTSCCQGCISLWLYSNLLVNYQDYPYQFPDVSNFILYEKYMLDDIRNNNNNEFISYEPVADKASFTGHPYFYSLDFQYGNNYDRNGTFQGALRGRFFRILGPEAEYRRVYADGGDLNYYAFGVNIPFFQFSGFIPEFYIQSSHLSGTYTESGLTYGLQFYSYPIKPFSIMARYGWIRMGQLKFNDRDFRLGVLINRFELFLSIRSLKVESTELGGYSCGVKLWL